MLLKYDANYILKQQSKTFPSPLLLELYTTSTGVSESGPQTATLRKGIRKSSKSVSSRPFCCLDIESRIVEKIAKDPVPHFGAQPKSHTRRCQGAGTRKSLGSVRLCWKDNMIVPCRGKLAVSSLSIISLERVLHKLRSTVEILPATSTHSTPTLCIQKTQHSARIIIYSS